VVLVYDITNRDSYNNIIKWLDETKNYANEKVTVVLVGNKTDLDSKRVVTFEEGYEFAKRNGLNFM